MSRSVLAETDDFCIEGEEAEGLLFLHCEVDNFSKSVLKEIREAFYEILDAASDIGKYVYSVTKNERFVKALGIPYEVVTSDGDERLVTWEPR